MTRMSPSTAVARPKPLLRGVSHEVAAFAALAGWLLLARATPTPRAGVAVGVYGASLTVLFAVSALYHRPTWSPRARAVMRRFDHSAIFLLIAGTYTPFCMLLGGDRGMFLLVAVWGGALLGVLRALFWSHAPRAVPAALAVALGWLVVAVLPALHAAVGNVPMALLIAGGLAYSAGAVVYAIKRPDPLPAVFGYHEVFHALVVVAAVCHYAVVASAVRAIS
jgi:hemolysin III